MKKLLIALALCGFAGSARAALPTSMRPQPAAPSQPPSHQLGLEDRASHGEPSAPPATPEPLTMGALALGAAGIAAAKLRKKR